MDVVIAKYNGELEVKNTFPIEARNKYVVSIHADTIKCLKCGFLIDLTPIAPGILSKTFDCMVCGYKIEAYYHKEKN